MAGKRSDEQPTESHGALMDAVYRNQRYIYDATRKYYLLGRDRLIRSLAPPDGGTVLEVGCGTGRNLILAARRYPEARFYGFDISEAMLETARTNIARAGFADRITVVAGDATAFSTQELFGLASVDRVFCSYTLSMIPDWRAAIRCSVAALNETGMMHVVDFGQLENLPGPAKAVLDRWLRLFHVTPRRELRDELAAAAKAADRTLTFDSLYRGYSWAATIA